MLVSVALSIWLLQSQQHSNEQLQALQVKFEKLQEGVNSFAQVQNKVRQEQPGQKPEEVEQRAYEELGKELGLDPAMLKKQLPHFAEELKKVPNTTTYERANAAYVSKDYNEAERLALAAAAPRKVFPGSEHAIRDYRASRLDHRPARFLVRKAEALYLADRQKASASPGCGFRLPLW